VSHFAIRHHLYHASQTIAEERVLALHIRSFLSGFAATVAQARAFAAARPRTARHPAKGPGPKVRVAS
jgi:hypothetical protein